MPTKRYSVERILPKLRQGGRIKYRALKDDEARRLKALEQEPRGRVIVVALRMWRHVASKCPRNLSPKKDRLSGSLYVGQDPLSSNQISARRRHHRRPTPSYLEAVAFRRCDAATAWTG